MNITLRVWRQNGPKAKGALHEYHLTEISEDASFLEMLDILNEQLFAAGEEPIAFDSDCREGICGMCGVVINGVPHGPHKDRTTTCQLHMRTFKDGDTITIEPWRSKAFPILRDLVVNREAYDRIVQAGGYISVNTGAAPEAHSVPVPKDNADMAFEAAACIGCGACAAACPNGSAMLFTSAKVMHLGLLPQGKPENYDRVVNMLNQHDAEGFGACQNIGECAKVCPKQIPLDCISYLNRQLGKAFFKGK
ncbi:succinate dehydrogenase/fumarate reductase iron-sulfur subunit [Mobiluncus mulieris]|uniref:Succinate dehydrogenase and fumarate reductase iron-sulfur protein n=2 Tax=Mobiluncus mulieris TaxID=2052 RepID=E0QTC9_9ACTO|nr:succinate dehydrogenase/fumarate reductase iron-sulfur subunit [Mobiluncus mulieris]EEJ53575.1 succinate dehydrogenase and fumarate reductase iron-sulfur protein [Mobiluncus mulieris ATCC 35243]EEZ91405.1 succinate dehydrogenase/fumarate reductase iron-sulfur subunit [Mobiluncus mulieris 28-1]EFM45166.1 succinate dehydrogenase and fumarate reductase iron-sulfur protein [Mobiluncus mulieris ATCC 35239]EFN92431.1 succinate dehydrogenase/fumarate reductase iron-sulfur subunit [Mobiluncus mulier